MTLNLIPPHREDLFLIRAFGKKTQHPRMVKTMNRQEWFTDELWQPSDIAFYLGGIKARPFAG